MKPRVRLHRVFNRWFNVYVGDTWDSANTHRETDTDQLMGECCAESVQYVRALRGSVEQVTDGDGAARRRHIQHCGAWENDRDDTELCFFCFVFFISTKSTVFVKSNVTYSVSVSLTNPHQQQQPSQWELKHTTELEAATSGRLTCALTVKQVTSSCKRFPTWFRSSTIFHYALYPSSRLCMFSEGSILLYTQH